MMVINISNNGFIFYGKVKELPKFLASYPLNLTLQELVRLNLH